MRPLLLASTLALLLAGCATTGPHGTSAPGLDPELTNFPYPFETHVFAIESQRERLRMVYMDERPADWNGRTVLLLHGKNFSGAYWAPTIRALTARGFRVVAPDQIGFGKSSKPDRYQFSFSQLALNTMSLLDSLQVQRVVVVGHSMGGMLASRIAIDHPERTEQLVLVNPIGLEDYRALAGYRSIDRNYEQELEATPESIRAYQQQNYFAGKWKPEYDPYVEILAGWTESPEYPRVAWDAALTTDMILTQPVVYEFPRITRPTLLIIGTRDRTALGRGWAPPDEAPTMGDYTVLGKRTARAIPGARLVELEGLGHIPQAEDFDAYFAPLVEFIERR
ncbi:alpha/beta fold hydrolase [Vulgatibacter incomptus]|uniref:2-hydroxy-6-oxo-6-phenylhexa-2,4-dienoate hydrolase n=1 Tax=Vulgatibacter incomptus TaxID=1391653 RepID=A0A0K1PEE9_9BACT|nr:alpha/beta hydrolase [Vulgatibacter incomptus]AKU91877.1 2-hydroxy-6-oxo-6-phenylhexa-2,4-dienoate hydrolase [Vulgatibacter incomptus]